MGKEEEQLSKRKVRILIHGNLELASPRLQRQG